MEAYLVSLGLSEGVIAALHLGLLGRLLLAAILGGLIGLEREMSGKAAGLRTNLLICVGAALLMEISINLAVGANEAAGGQMRSDPARIAAQIVSGIGFIGAGSILQARGGITGLTTAATIWVVAAIGMAVGARFYVEAVGSTVLVAAALVVLARVERVMIRRHRHERYSFLLSPEPELITQLAESFRGKGLRVKIDAVTKGETEFEATYDVAGQARLFPPALESILGHPGVRRMTRSY